MCLALYSVFSDILEKACLSSLSLDNWGRYKAMVEKGEFAFEYDKDIEELNLAVSALHRIPWDPVIQMASLEQRWLDYCRVSHSQFIYAEIPVVHLFGAMVCLISSDMQRVWVPGAIDIIKKLAQDPGQQGFRGGECPVDWPLCSHQGDGCFHLDYLTEMKTLCFPNAVCANVLFACSALYYSPHSQKVASLVQVAVRQVESRSVRLCTALLFSLYQPIHKKSLF